MTIKSLRSCALSAAALLALSSPQVRAESFYAGFIKEFNPGADASQGAKAIAVDSHGNLLVTGFNQKSFGGENTVYTVKYDGIDGHIIWERTLTATLDMTPTSIAVDHNDNVIVVGLTSNGNRNIFVMKYTAAGAFAPGFSLLSAPLPQTYDGTATGEDIPYKVAVDSANNIIVVGSSVGTSAQEDFIILKFGPTGTLLNQERTNSSNRKDAATDVAIDSDDTIIAVGGLTVASSDTRMHIRKLNSNFTMGTFTPKTINTGGDDGASGVALNRTTHDVFVTGLFNNGNDYHGYQTVRYDSGGVLKWSVVETPNASDFSGKPTGIAVGPDGHPVVTGYLKDANGVFYGHTVKYDSETGNELWHYDDRGFGVQGGDTLLRRIVVDGGNNVIVVGESDFTHGSGNSGSDTDVYVAKYDGVTGLPVYGARYEGSFGSDDGIDQPALILGRGTDLAVDPLGNIALTCSPIRVKSEADKSSGRSEMTTIKLNRFIASPGDALPNSVTGLPDTATFLTGNAPSVGGNVAAKITWAAGAKRGTSIFEQALAGGTQIPATQGGPAPGATVGTTVGNFVSFTDPITAPDGSIAFAGRITGLAAKSNGVWTDLSGKLLLALRQGDPITGLNPAGNLVSVTNLSMENGSIFATAVVTGARATNSVLLRVDDTNNKTQLFRSGQSLTVDSDTFTVKSFTVLSSAPLSPGDGRWQTGSGMVIRAVGVNKANVRDVRSIVVRVDNNGNAAKILSTNTLAIGVEDTAMYKAFGVPSLGFGVFGFAFTGTLKPLAGKVSAANDSALLYSTFGSTFSALGREGQVTNVTNIPAAATYTAFSDPVLNDQNTIAYLGTYKGTGINATNNRSLIFGNATMTRKSIARTGDVAPKPAVDAGQIAEKDTKYAAFVAFGLPDGAGSGPVFVAKLSGAATAVNNTGLFALSGDGTTVRRLLRTGDVLGTRKVKLITLLNVVPKDFGAARSVNTDGVVTARLTFTNNQTALIAIGIP